MDALHNIILHDIPLWYILVPTVLVLLYYYLTKDFNKFEKYGIEGPNAYPLIGTAWPILQKGFITFDLELFKKYKHKRVCSLFEFGVSSIMVFDLKIVKEILIKQFPNFVNRTKVKPMMPPLDRSVIDLQDEHWRMVRGQLSPTFSGAKMKKMTPLIQKCADSFTDKLLKTYGEENKAFDGKTMFASYTMDVIASTMFALDVDSINCPDHPFVQHANDMINVKGIVVKIFLFLMVVFPKVLTLLGNVGFHFRRDSIDYFVGHMNQTLADREESEGVYHDFLALITKSIISEEEMDKISTDGKKWSDKGLTRTDIVAQMMIFFIAGFETSSSTMLLVAFNMAVHQDLQTRLQQEVDEQLGDELPNYDNVQKLQYLDMFISETTRLYPIAARLLREAAADVVIDGITIPKGTSVWIPVHTLHRDPSIWPDPDTFDPERFSPEQKADRDPSALMAFGLGPRNCVGMRLAMLELKIGLARIIQKSTLVLDDGTPTELKLQKFRMAPEEPLKFKISPR